MSSIHDQLGQRAVELLAPEEQKFWNREISHLPEYCFYPDLHLSSQWESPEMEAFYARYCLMPNGKCIPHGPVDNLWRGSCFFGQEIAAVPIEYVCTYYLRKIVDLIQKGEQTESARFAGTLAHFIQDCCTPGHVMNNIIMNRMFPGTGDMFVHLHAFLDKFPLAANSLCKRPLILGDSLFEACYLLSEMLRKETEEIIAEIVPLCLGIQSGRITKKCEKIFHNHQERAILWSASLWHTAFVLAGKRGKNPLSARPQNLAEHPIMLEYGKKFDRDRWIQAGIPFYPTRYPESDPCRSRLATIPYPYEPLINQALDRERKIHPLCLTRNGTPFMEKAPGIAMGSYGIASYRVPGKLYRTFDCWCGIHPVSPNDGEVHFAVWCHEAKKNLIFHQVCRRGGDALHVQISLPRECRTLSLLAAGPDAFGVSALWLNPVLK